jgi:2-polyprenyl-3-methyl-5-hydroxy-6-metoxy-1,4-benzoquinol methylase
VPRSRDPSRHDRLNAHLRELWRQEDVAIEVCGECSFGYAVPFVGGDADFYALAHEGDPHYPWNRWEFHEALTALRELEVQRPLRILEVGAGHGAFLDLARAQTPEAEVVAADYDLGAVSVLRSKGYATLAGSLRDATGPFDVVCMFQTLEHMADLDDVFAQLARLTLPGGSILVSVPNGDATTVQENLIGLWDMPPNHVARWTPRSLRQAAQLRGFQLQSLCTEPVRAASITRQLAVSEINAYAYVEGSLAQRVNALSARWARGPLKRVIAAAGIPRIWRQRAEFKPLTVFAHLRNRA